jgi:rhodanese-related sulfurtransferase
MWPFSRSARAPGAGAVVDVPTIDVNTAFARSKRGAKLIDVRSSREFGTGHPRGARSVPPQLIKKDETGLGRDDDILVICLSGHRSPRQAKRLVGMGFVRVTNVQGGLMAWMKAGLPVKK